MPRSTIAPSLLGLLLLTAVTSLAAQETPPLTVINPEALPDTTQFGYSQATVTEPGSRVVHVAGQVGFDEEAEDNGFEAQVDRAFEHLAAVLEAAGATPPNVTKITLLIVDHDADKLAYLGEKRRAAFGNAPPASTLIPVTRLYAPGVLFEIDAVAVTAPRG